MSMLTPAQIQALNQQAVIGDPRTANPLAGGILGASTSPFANSLLSGPRLTDQGSQGLQDFVAQVRAGNIQLLGQPSGQPLDPNAVASFEQALAEARQRGISTGAARPLPYAEQYSAAQARQLPELPPELQAISGLQGLGVKRQIDAFYADPEAYYAQRAQQSNPTGSPQPVPPPIQQMQSISAPPGLGGQMGGQMGAGMSGPQFPGQGGGQGGIGNLLQPIQAQIIKQFNQQKVVPLLNDFERNAQATITGSQGMMQGIMNNNPFDVT